MEKLYFGGSIITMEQENDHPEAVLVRDDLIAGVGSLAELSASCSPDAIKVDLHGQCLMPAFVDGHSHITNNGQMSIFASLSECKCLSDIADTMRSYIAENQIAPDNVAVGFSYDQNFLKEQRHPDKFLLDEVSREVPILLIHVSGHMGAANTKMLELCGYTSDTPDPQGGKISRIPGTSEPDGYLEERAMMNARYVMNQHVKHQPEKQLSNMQKAYLEHGITTVQDGATSRDNMKLLIKADEMGLLDVDVVAYPLAYYDPLLFCEEYHEYLKQYHGHIKIGGLKMVLDGSPQGRSAWMSRPYEGSEDYCGYPIFTDEDVDGFARLAVDNSLQLLSHCNGDAASEQFLNAYEKALRESSNPEKYDLRPVMIHCQTVRDDQLDRMAELPMIASVFVGHVYYWGDIHVKNFGSERGNHISPVKAALDRGLSVNLHQDTPVTKPDMLHSIWCAVNRQSRTGKTIGADQKISVYEALKAATLNGAYEYFEEDQKGSIRPGKLADLIILNADPLQTDPMKIREIQVMETIKNGKTLYRRKDS